MHFKIKKFVWISIVFLIFIFNSHAQNTIIYGQIKDVKQIPIAGVNISIKNSYDGATSDSTGKFSFSTSETNQQLILVTAVGYKPIEQLIKINGTNYLFNAILKEEFNELKAVVITAGSFEASDKKRTMAVLDPIDIVTTASANGEITGALKTLPGTQQVGETEGLFVRGGTAAETKTFIDGTLVNNFYYSSQPNMASYSRFSPFLFKGTVFSTGGYSALYGQALSSALILESIDLVDRSSANFGVSALGLNAGFQSLSKNKKSTWGLNYNYTNLGLAFLVIKQKQNYTTPPIGHMVDANYRIKTSKTGILKFYGYFSYNKLNFSVPSIDSIGFIDRFALKNNSYYGNFSWKESLKKGWKVMAGFSYSYNQDIIYADIENTQKQTVLLPGLEFKNFNIKSTGRYTNYKLVFEKKLKGLIAIRFGSELNNTHDIYNYYGYYGNQFEKLIDNTSALFFESDLYVTNNIAIKTGLRYEHNQMLNKNNVAPRISFAYKLGVNAQVSFAYGIFYQTPEKKYLPGIANLGFMQATHYIAQFQKIFDSKSLRAEIFYKKYNHLEKTSLINYQQKATSVSGYGEANGFELFWRDKKSIKNVDYWISYSYLDTKRNFLNFPYAITPNFAAKHTLSVVTKKFIQKAKLNVNASYNYATGRPYYNIGFNGTDYVFTDKGNTPSYQNLSFALNYLPFIGKTNRKLYDVYVLSISNIFNFKQLYGYNYSYNGIRKEEITPAARTFIFIGAFLSLGVNRSDEIINNGL